MKIRLPLFCSIFLAISGCASIGGDNTREVKVTSHPAGASIYVENQRYGETPTTIKLPSHIYGGKSVTLKKPGYAEKTLMVNTKYQPIALLDILFWPTFIVDWATGDLVKIDPVNLNLNYDLERA